MLCARSLQSGRTAYRETLTNKLYVVCIVAGYVCPSHSVTGSRDWLHRFPALRAYNPDLIIISAGFDGSHGDTGNTKTDGRGTLGGLDLTPQGMYS
jgi:hypothetical protein